MIQDHITLPLNVALGVAMQGMRIRFGRSLVTVIGVVLGIAFLMAVLTEQVVSDGVKGEERLRAEVERMYSFLAAEMGPAKGRTIGVVRTGELSVEERRFLVRLEDVGLARILWVDLTNRAKRDPAPAFRLIAPQKVAMEDIGIEASAVIAVGDGTLSVDAWEALQAGTRSTVLCVTRTALRDALAAVTAISLGRELRDDELAAMAEEQRRTSFRNAWIVVISLVVTVIGISNAMLISVTERFREIATMKCLGAVARFIRLLFLIEATIMGFAGATIGTLLGIAFTLIMYGFVYRWGLVIGSVEVGVLLEYSALALAAGVVLAILAAIYPAHIASDMVPADALRSHI
jgi:hypothetical protein